MFCVQKIKLIILPIIFAVIFILFSLLKASNAKQELLQTKLNVADQLNIIYRKNFTRLKNENDKLNQLIIKRARAHNKARTKLDADIKKLKKELSQECYNKPWPDFVTNKLREQY